MVYNMYIICTYYPFITGKCRCFLSYHGIWLGQVPTKMMEKNGPWNTIK